MNKTFLWVILIVNLIWSTLYIRSTIMNKSALRRRKKFECDSSSSSVSLTKVGGGE